MLNLKLKEISISLIIAFAILILMEGGSRLAYTPTHLDKIMAILEESNSNFWKVRGNLDLMFFGANIKTNSHGFRVTPGEENWATSKVRLAVLGASPSFGWGVENDQTYSSTIFRQSDKKISVKNFSQVGYSSFQGPYVLDIALRAKPTHVLLTYVINDLDYYRFFYSQNIPDKEVVTSSNLTTVIREFIRKLTLPKLLLSKLSTSQKGSKYIERETRVSISDYISNISRMVNITKKAGITPILVKFPVNIPTLKSSRNNTKEIQSNKIRKRSYLYNQKLEKYAKENNISLIDFTKVVNQSKKYLFLDPNGDTIHPNTLGHSLFANEVLEYFRKI